MNTAELVASIVTTAGTGLLICWFIRKAEDPPHVEGDVIHLRYPKVLWGFSVACGVLFAIAAIGIAAAVAMGLGGDKLFRMSWFAVPLFALLGFGTLFEMRVDLRADGDGLRGRTAFRGQRQIRWRELVSVTYSAGLNTFKMTDGDGNCMRMSRYLLGHAEIVALMDERLPEAVAGKAIEKYRNAVTAGF